MSRPTTWIFDVDGCLIDSFNGTSLRPLAEEILCHLTATGAHVVVWSAGGAEYAKARLTALGVHQHVARFDEKDGRDQDGRYLTTRLDVDLTDAVFIDDRPEDMPLRADVLAVRPYLIENPRDQGLHGVAERAGLMFRNDHYQGGLRHES